MEVLEPSTARCEAAVSEARRLLRAGCDDLLLATGLALDPDALADALTSPMFAAAIGNEIDTACRQVLDPLLLLRAQSAVEFFAKGSGSLRTALAMIAETQIEGARAISAYQKNV